MKILSNVNVDAAALADAAANLKNAITSIESTKVMLKQKYKQLGNGWNDRKYIELGNIIHMCLSALNNIEQNLLKGEKYVILLIQDLQEYENINFNSTNSSNSISSSLSGASQNSNVMTNEQRAILVKQTGQQWANNLSQAEAMAVRDYTGTHYLNINNVLRGIESDFAYGNENRSILIHNALQNAQMPCDCTVYRGASARALGEYQNLSDEQLIGLTIMDDGFMSTSLNPNDAFSGEVRFELSVPEGTHGAYVGYLSNCGHYESEVLLDAGRQMEITDVRRDMFGNLTICARIIN